MTRAEERMQLARERLWWHLERIEKLLPALATQQGDDDPTVRAIALASVYEQKVRAADRAALRVQIEALRGYPDGELGPDLIPDPIGHFLEYRAVLRLLDASGTETS